MPRAKKSRAKLTPEERRAKQLANLKPSKKGDPSRNPLGINGSTWLTKVREYLTKDEESMVRGASQPATVPRYENTLAAIHKQALLGNFAQQQWEMSVLGVNPAQRHSLEGPDGEALPAAAPPAVVTLYMPAGANTREDPNVARVKRKSGDRSKLGADLDDVPGAPLPDQGPE